MPHDIRRIAILVALLLVVPALVFGQYEGVPYVWEGHPAVQAKLAAWQDLKLGFMVHWGTYSQKGWCESWGLCSEDVDWLSPPQPSYQAYYDTYVGLEVHLRPRRSSTPRPGRGWRARRACATSSSPPSTTTASACSTRSKPPTRSPTPAAPSTTTRAPTSRATSSTPSAPRACASAPTSRSPTGTCPGTGRRTGSTARATSTTGRMAHPEIWQKFVDFTHAQVEELCTGYGPLDILWLDGAWVAPDNLDQDLRMDRLAATARRHQPGMLIVDRWVGGPYENYRTPEQKVPETPLEMPWETCMPLAGAWSYNADDVYKPTRQLVHLLVDVVAKGGNLLLNAGADGRGTFHRDVAVRLRELGDWMRVNGEAIYATRPVAPFKEGKVCFTKRRDDGVVHAIYLPDEGEALPEEIVIAGVQPLPGETVRLLGYPEPLAWEPAGQGLRIHVPAAATAAPPCQHAWTLRLGQVVERTPPRRVKDLAGWRLRAGARRIAGRGLRGARVDDPARPRRRRAAHRRREGRHHGPPHHLPRRESHTPRGRPPAAPRGRPHPHRGRLAARRAVRRVRVRRALPWRALPHRRPHPRAAGRRHAHPAARDLRLHAAVRVPLALPRRDLAVPRLRGAPALQHRDRGGQPRRRHAAAAHQPHARRAAPRREVRRRAPRVLRAGAWRAAPHGLRRRPTAVPHQPRGARDRHGRGARRDCRSS